MNLGVDSSLERKKMVYRERPPRSCEGCGLQIYFERMKVGFQKTENDTNVRDECRGGRSGWEGPSLNS